MSMLDDFLFYEDWQKIMYEEKTRILGRTYDGPFYVPSFMRPNKPIGVVNINLKADKKVTKHNYPDSLGKTMASTSKQALVKSDAISSSNSTNDNANQKVVEDVDDITTALKIGSLTINPKQAIVKPLEATAVTDVGAEPDVVVSVGSKPVKINWFGSSPEILTVGTIPIDPQALKPAGGNPL